MSTKYGFWMLQVRVPHMEQVHSHFTSAHWASRAQSCRGSHGEGQLAGIFTCLLFLLICVVGPCLSGQGQITDSKRLGFFTNATEFEDQPEGGFKGPGDGPGSGAKRERDCDKERHALNCQRQKNEFKVCSNAFDAACFVVNGCWSQFGGFLGILAGIGIGLALLGGLRAEKREQEKIISECLKCSGGCQLAALQAGCQVLIKTGMLSRAGLAMAKCVCPGGGGRDAKRQRQKDSYHYAPQGILSAHGHHAAAPLRKSKATFHRSALNGSCQGIVPSVCHKLSESASDICLSFFKASLIHSCFHLLISPVTVYPATQPPYHLFACAALHPCGGMPSNEHAC
eukprot:1142808-Pelagomonas_calceolata.AAC.1